MTCKNCKWAKWKRDKAGRVMSHRIGECTAVYILDDAPVCVSSTFDFNPRPSRNAICGKWEFDHCPMYEVKE